MKSWNLLRTALLLALWLTVGAGHAQTYPTKTVRALVAFGPGGQIDIVARIVAQKLSERWKQPVAVENRVGANGNIGTEAAVKSPADGYTLYFVTGTVVVNSVIARIPNIDPIRDLAPVSSVGTSESLLVVTPSLPVKTLAELVTLAKSRPGQLNYGSSSAPIAMEQFKLATGLEIQHVPYTNFGNLVTDLISGRVQVLLSPLAPVLPHAQAGKLKALGVTGDKRLATLPDVPRINETYPDFRASFWYALLVPAKTPPEIIAQISADTRWALQQPDVRQRLAVAGIDPTGSTPEELKAYIARELEGLQKLEQRGIIKASS